MKRHLPALLLATAVSAAPHGLGLIVAAQSAGGARCAALTNLKLTDVRITAASAVPAATMGAIRAPYCRAEGVIGAEIRVVVYLPDKWNERFFMGGGGGFAGSVENSVDWTVQQAYATAGTDTGHQADGMSASWALNNTDQCDAIDGVRMAS